MLRAKWVSILYHIKNVHEWEDHDLFTECAHREYTSTEVKTRAWLKETVKNCKGQVTFERLEALDIL